jgi:hypothetical protein
LMDTKYDNYKCCETRNSNYNVQQIQSEKSSPRKNDSAVKG